MEAWNEQLVSFELLISGFRRACNATETIEKFIKVGNFIVCLQFAGEGLIPHILPAIAHLSIDKPIADPDLTICLWDTVSTNIPISPLLDGLVQLIEHQRYEQLTPRQEIRLISNPRVPATFAIWTGVFSMLDIKRNLAVYWINDATALPYHEKSAPLRTILNWWLNTHNHQCVHAAAVGTKDGGVLITGKSGSGKSTTALACLDSDLLYASDDYCLITSDPIPYAYSLYNTAKLNGEADIQRQPHFRSMICNPEQVGQDKLMMFMEKHLPHKLSLGFPLRAILVPKVMENTATPQVESTLQRVSGAIALRALAPTSMCQLPGTQQSSFSNMVKLIKQLPCYQLKLGSNIPAIPQTIIGLLSNGR